jgi:hypothetical protein
MNHLRILTVILGFFAFLTSSINLFGIAWDPPVTLSSTISIKPQIAISPFGYAVAIWQEFDGTNTNIQAATIVRGGTWSSPETISSVPGNTEIIKSSVRSWHPSR